ncbi:MAG TPA: aminotransferase class I/II-fold pyridoxal phosphate-dependent enzyme [Vicinamibacterales bacterium]|nr:aminotransferase class I/II-fold pyridoxal phosphate-dependent enzyme [Vicinamibacterales bacterium]
MKPATELIRRDEVVHDPASPLTTPIYETTTFVFENAQQVRDYNEGRSAKFLYSRYANPTVVEVERKIAALEGAGAALVLSSGQAATMTALLALCGAGDEIVCSSAIYGGTLHLMAELLPKFGIASRFVSLEDLRRPDAVLSGSTRLLWFESPINPTLRCVDVAAVAAACRERGVTSVVDNTFASPINQQPLSLGVDIVMHSATKYLNGHSDVTAGVLAGPPRFIDAIGEVRKLAGTVLDPSAAWALGRGLKTLAVRMERHNTNALAIARWLAQDRRVQTVYYPGLESHPDHAIAARQMRGFGGMVCVDLGGGYDRAARFFDRLQVFKRAASLGGVESLCSLPLLTSQWGHSAEELARAGVTDSMARLSVGLEDPEDLIADLDQALG